MNGRILAPGQKARHSFGKIRTFLPLPNLIDVQRKSYVDFLQMDLLPEERQEVGLQAVFRSVFPFSDFRETCALEYVSYRIGDWKSRSGRLEGLQHLRFPCEGLPCGQVHRTGEIQVEHRCAISDVRDFDGRDAPGMRQARHLIGWRDPEENSAGRFFSVLDPL